MDWLRITLLIIGTVLLCGVLVNAVDNCQTLKTEMLVTKEKTYEYNGRKKRLICAGKVEINKCEGSCTSQVSPSVVQFPGFKKDCKCCREADFVNRLFTLKECVDEGALVPGETNTLLIKEPSNCACFDCAM